MERWREVLMNVFGSKSRKKWRTVAIDIMLVDTGIKRAYLFDQWASSREEMDSLLINLHKHQLICRVLGILTVELDFLIFSPQSFKDPMSESVPKIVNVSFSLNQPILIEGKESKICYETFQELNEFKKSLSLGRETSDRTSTDLMLSYEVKVSDLINPPCLFGLLLGYPCVYWSNRLEGDDNCLSMQPLRLFQVKGLFHRDSVRDYMETCSLEEKIANGNHHLKTDSSILQDVTQNFGDHFCSVMEGKKEDKIHSGPAIPSHSDPSSHNHVCDHHVIFSFTVSENIYSPAVKTHVDNWFTSWKSHVSWTSVFHSVWMEEELRKPQAVCL